MTATVSAVDSEVGPPLRYGPTASTSFFDRHSHTVFFLAGSFGITYAILSTSTLNFIYGIIIYIYAFWRLITS